MQAEVETGLRTVTRVPDLRVTCAGRTDAGVHARDQHVHVDVPEENLLALATGRRASSEPSPGSSQLLATLGARLNGVLPADVRVLDVRWAPQGFDARFSAQWREYTYNIADRQPVDPLRRHMVWQRRGALDLPRMNELGSSMLGERDFSALCRRREGASSVRTLLSLLWSRDSATAEAVMTVRADAFCHSMVRSLVGLMVLVGEGSRDSEWARTVVAEQRRLPEVPAAPAHALVLAAVGYASDPGAQAERARRFRG